MKKITNLFVIISMLLPLSLPAMMRLGSKPPRRVPVRNVSHVIKPTVPINPFLTLVGLGGVGWYYLVNSVHNAKPSFFRATEVHEDVHIKEYEGVPPLSTAMHPQVPLWRAKRLVVEGANPNELSTHKDHPGTPLHALARHCGRYTPDDIMGKCTLLFRAGIDVDTKTIGQLYTGAGMHQEDTRTAFAIAMQKSRRNFDACHTLALAIDDNQIKK
jgi:hypothetical protein